MATAFGFLVVALIVASITSPSPHDPPEDSDIR